MNKYVYKLIKNRLYINLFRDIINVSLLTNIASSTWLTSQGSVELRTVRFVTSSLAPTQKTFNSQLSLIMDAKILWNTISMAK